MSGGHTPGYRVTPDGSVFSNPTPGPWRVNPHTREVFTDQDRTIARAHLDSRTRSYAESVANARLIAAAPELLEALENIVRHADVLDRVALPIDAAEAAIAKARGQ